MSVIDPNFPLPSSDFLMVYSLLVEGGSNPSAIVDDEGTWTKADEAATAVPTIGYISAPDAKEVARAATQGYVIDAVALVPHATTVTRKNRIIAADGRIPHWLLGTYDITAVRPNAAHQRLLLTRLVRD